MRKLLRLAVAVLAPLGVLLAGTMPASAHPMGNFSINHFSSLTIANGAVRLLYVVDMAEIPTFQELGDLNATHSANLSSAQRASYLRKKSVALAGGLSLSYDGRALPLTIVAVDLLFPPGAGGLPTERIYLALQARLPGTVGTLSYQDATFPDRAGWKEIVAAAGSGMRLVGSTAPAVSRSQALTVYPSNATSSPPQDLSASLHVAAAARSARGAGAPPALDVIHQAEAPLRAADGSWSALALRLAARGPAASKTTSWAQGRTDALSSLIARHDLSPAVIALSLLIAVALGAFHAFSPGHGKTVVAAYIVGSRATAWHAALLGLTVTITHTAGVFALGLVTLWLSHYIVPDKLYPWLGALSGLFIVAIGLTLAIKRFWALRRRSATAYSAQAEHVHSHHLRDMHYLHDGHAYNHAHDHQAEAAHEQEHGYMQEHGAAHLHMPDGRVISAAMVMPHGPTQGYTYGHADEEGDYVALGT